MSTWLPIIGPSPLIGDTIYIATPQSRRKARVVATRPGYAMLQWQE